eukprot:PhF_6_TR15664/c0_g1_i1/m.24340/K03978/engB; GTP-binding protein
MLRRPQSQWWGYVGLRPRRDLTPRESRVVELADNIYGRGVQFLKSSPSLEFLPIGLQSYPEVCFVGRTNSGKSMLLHAISGNKDLARPSRKPGNTRNLRFFCVGDAFLICDSVGYGFWKTGGQYVRSEHLCSTALVKQYIVARSNLKKVYWVIDSSVRITNRDIEYHAWLQSQGVPFTVLMSKIDKLSPPKLIDFYANELSPFLGIGQRKQDEMERWVPPVLAVSSKTGTGIQDLMYDMVYNVVQELTDENLTLKHLKELSYLPLSPTELNNVQLGIRPETQVLPRNIDQPFPKWSIMSNVKGKPGDVVKHLQAFQENSPDRMLTGGPNNALTTNDRETLKPMTERQTINSIAQRDDDFANDDQADVVGNDKLAPAPPLLPLGFYAYKAQLPGSYEWFMKKYVEPGYMVNKDKVFLENIKDKSPSREKLFLDKYVLIKDRKDRSIMTTSEYLCPYYGRMKLGGGTTVLGVPATTTQPGKIRGLKQNPGSIKYGPGTVRQRNHHRAKWA